MVGTPIALQTALAFLKVTTIFQTAILEHDKSCSHIVHVLDASNENFQAHIDTNPDTVNLVQNQLISNGTTKPNSFPTHFSSPCALNVQDFASFARSVKEETETGRLSSWTPPTATMASPAREYHVLIQTCNEEITSEISPTVRKIYHLYFVTICNGFLKLSRITPNGQRVVTIMDNFPPISSSKWLHTYPNFKGEPLNIVTCGTCPEAIEEYQRTGKWYISLTGVIYEFSMLINGTFEAEEVLSFPRDEPDEDGDWDDWFQSIADGSAAITMIHRVSQSKKQLVYLTVPTGYDDFSFITAKPKRIPGSQNLLQLFTPFTLDVWLATLISLGLLFLVIEIAIVLHMRRKSIKSNMPRRISVESTVMQSGESRCDRAMSDASLIAIAFLPLHRNSIASLTGIERRGSREYFMAPKTAKKFTRNFEPHKRHLTLAALLKPVLGQGPLSSEKLVKTVEGESVHRLLFSLWLLALIVLGCGYTSVMTSQIVLPIYTKPPTNFKELSSSDYAISTIVWAENWEHDFKKLNASYLSRIISSVNDYNPLEPDCYISIFQGRTACLGSSKLMQYLGIVYLVDEKGRALYVRSAEKRFPNMLYYGVGVFYPQLHEPLNEVVEAFWEAGLINLWESNHMAHSIKVGKAYQRKKQLKIREANAQSSTEDESSLAIFLLRIAALGNGVAFSVRIFEALRIGFPILVRTARIKLGRVLGTKLDWVW